MGNALEKFSSFILENANEEAAMDFLYTLKLKKENIHVFNQLRIDDVRKIKDIATISHNYKIAFMFGNIGFDAQNALLKLTEEPPENTIFVFYKPDTLLETIYSRCQVIRLKKDYQLDNALKLAIKNKDKAYMLKYLFSLKNKDEIIDTLQKLLFYFSKENKIKQAKGFMDILKDYREFNLNQHLVLINIFSYLME